MEKNLIYGIIALVIIAASGFFIYNFAKEAYSGFKVWDDLSESEKSEVTDTFYVFIDNMEKCRSIDDNNCICKDVFPSFPYMFRKEVSIKFTEEKGAKLNAELLFNKKNISIEKQMNNMIISSTKENPEEKADSYLLRQGSKNPILEGKKTYGIVLPKDYTYDVLAQHIQKRESKAMLYFITSSISKSVNVLDEYPVCMPDRAEAISKFDSFLSKLSTETNMTIDLPSDYKIYYERRVIKLMYNNEAVRRLVNDKLELVGKIDYADNIKCDNPTTPNYLVSGDKINIEKTSSGFCLKKI